MSDEHYTSKISMSRNHKAEFKPLSKTKQKTKYSIFLLPVFVFQGSHRVCNHYKLGEIIGHFLNNKKSLAKTK